MAHIAKGICWAGLMNDGKDGLVLELDKLMGRMARKMETLEL
jgi:hypothetical protein